MCTVNDAASLLVEKQGLVEIPVKYVIPYIYRASESADRLSSNSVYTVTDISQLLTPMGKLV